MTWLMSLFTGLISGVVGALALGFLADRWTVWFRVSNFEGGAGYFVLFQGLLGAVGGFVIGVVVSRMTVVGAEAHFGRGLLLALAWDAGIVGFLAVASYLIADHPPRLNGKALTLEIEIHTPSAHPLVASTAPRPMVSIENGAGRTTSYGTADSAAAIHEAEEQRWRVSLSLPLLSSSSSRTLRVTWGEGFSWTVAMPLRGQPTEADVAWTEWKAPTETSVRDAWARPDVDLKFLVRYRVALERPVPARPTVEVDGPSVEAREMEALERVTSAAPLRDFVLWTREGVSASVRQRAVEAIARRESVGEELTRLMADEDDGWAAEALRLVERLPDPAAFVPAVTQAGRDLRDRLARIVEIGAVEDPGYEAAAGFSIRFSAWMAAARHLRREAGGDFTGELRAILVLARRRPDSQVLRGDVVRVASFYLHEWAGDEPLPSDPPPR